MIAFLAGLARSFLWGVLVAAVAVEVFWAWMPGPQSGAVVRFAVLAVVAAGAAVGLAALPGGRRRKGR